MPAYAYPITIYRYKKRIDERQHLFLNGDVINIPDLEELVGTNSFTIEQNEHGTGYDITVYTPRLETDEELAVRVARETEYMEQYRLHQIEYANQREQRRLLNETK